MTVTNVGQLGERIIEVQHILNYVQATPASERKTIAEIYKALADKATNEVQVSSTLGYYYKKGVLSRMREGKSYYYWGKGAQPANPVGLSPAPKAEFTPEVEAQIYKALALLPDKTERPEIRVEANRIIIEHPKCRIIVELL